MADHGLAHGGDRRIDGGQQPTAVDPDPGVVGVEVTGHKVGVGELVTPVFADVLEADAEGLEAVLAELRQQGNDEAGVEAARQQHADRHVGDRSAFHGDPELLADRVAPVALAQLQ